MNAIEQPLPKVFRPMPDEVFNATPPHLRVRYMVKRIVNQARRANPDKKKVRVRTFNWWHWRCLLRFKRRLIVVDYV